MKIKIAAGDSLYHPVHGMCRIDRLIHENQQGKKAVSYSLVPKTMKRMKVRFVIAAEQMNDSGFYRPISAAEADDILNYLKAGDASAGQVKPTWLFAQTLLNFCFTDFPAREQKKRQILDYSAKGLTGELASVLNLSLKKAAEMIMKSLRPKGNLAVFAALTRAGED